MHTLKFKDQQTNTFLAAVNLMLSTPPSFQLLPSTQQSNQILDHGSDNIVGSWEEPLNFWLTVDKNTFVSFWILESACYWKAQ